MSANDRYIPLTLRLERELYRQFHDRVTAMGATHSGVIRLLVREWVAKASRESRPRITAAR
jgi:broad specificity phosphatase PhoE